MLTEQRKTTPKQATPSNHNSNINDKRAKNNESWKRNRIVEEGEKEKEYEKTKGKRSDYEKRKGKRANTSNELKEENKGKEHRKSNKNNKRREGNNGVVKDKN